MAFRGKRRTGRNRFRKRRGLWLPTLGTNWEDEGTVFYDSAFTIVTENVLEGRADGPVQDYRSIVPDFTFEPSGGTGNIAASLHDRVQGNEWKLDRIVGSCHVHVQERDEENQWKYLQVAAGFFVARAEDDDQSAPDLYQDEWDPLNRDNIQNSWLWRRTWMLGNPGGEAVLRDDFPISNSAYGSSWMDGTVDVKTKRRIRREHRLWFGVSAIGWNGGQLRVPSPTVAQPVVQCLLDIRLYGQMINNPRGSSSF